MEKKVLCHTITITKVTNTTILDVKAYKIIGFSYKNVIYRKGLNFSTGLASEIQKDRNIDLQLKKNQKKDTAVESSIIPIF